MTLIGENAGSSHSNGIDLSVRPSMRVLGMIIRPLMFAKNIAQGACAGLLTLLGALHMTGDGSLLGSVAFDPKTTDASALVTLAETALQGGIPGAIEIMGAIALFLNAGNGWGRVLGLLGFVAMAYVYANGMDHSELFKQATDIFESLQGNFGKVNSIASS